MNKRTVLLESDFGQRVAEEETSALVSYFVETDYWSRLLRGDIDVVYGPKGAGKSALYSLLVSRTDELFDSGVLLVPGENPRGATAFNNLVADPPATEIEFVGLWKLYFAILLHDVLNDYGVRGDAVGLLAQALEREGLVKGTLSLSRILRAAHDYVRRAINPQAIEGNVVVDPTTQMPVGFSGKIMFGEMNRDQARAGYKSVDELLEMAQSALEDANLNAWVMLDRLDVAFVDSEDLETNALRALFRTYLDLLAYPRIKLKIFLRSDIWRRISEGGFREASHITRHVTIEWNRTSLLNLMIRRLLHNSDIRAFYGLETDLSHASTEDQEAFFYRVFPAQVDVGQRKSTTLDWLLTHTRDSSQQNAPRELIHMLNSLREVELRRLEMGEAEPDGETLFSRASFRDALAEVSRVRFNQTYLAENPKVRVWIEPLRGQKTSQTPETLAKIWEVEIDLARHLASKLAATGFFEVKGSREEPSYWVPFLYRDALDMVQGSAD